jgi:predicted RNase H-like HicB family nuclease
MIHRVIIGTFEAKLEDMMGLDFVKSIEDVRTSIRRFNTDLERRPDLAARLTMYRAWYYDPELDMVGPSKFIGYADMSAERYIILEEGATDGKQTEPVLKRWFQTLDKSSPEEAFVRSRAETLVAKYGKSLSKVARFCAPIGWKVPSKESVARPGIHATRGRRTIHATIVKGETHYVAECEQLAVVTQGTTIDETIQNLREAVELHLEGEDLATLGLAPDPIIMVSMELQPWAA